LDGGKEFGSKAFEDWLRAEGVVHKKSAPYKHEQNGVAERGIQNVSQQAMCQLFGVNMSEGFWPYAVKTAIYLINRSPTTTLDSKTPFEAWMGKRLNIKHLHMFGETGYVHIPPEMRKKWTKKSCLCRFLGYTPRSRNYKLWDPDRRVVVVSPNVDFDKSLAMRSMASTDRTLNSLRDAFGIRDAPHVEEKPHVEAKARIEIVGDNASEWELDAEILQLKATKDDDVPDGPDPVVPLNPREPDAPIRRVCRPEVKQIADAAGPPPAQEKRRPRAAIGTVGDSVAGIVVDHRTSVGVVEINKKIAANARKHAYCEALLAAENTHLHNEPADVAEAKRRPNWHEWKTAMQEELNSVERHGTYERVSELPPGRKAVRYKWVFKLKLNPDNLIA